MIRNYVLTALRGIRRHKAYSLVNIFGLVIGLACCFFILLWVEDELSFDRYHDEGDQIYRVMATSQYADGQSFTGSAVAKPLVDVLDETYPEITHSVLFDVESEAVLAVGDRIFRESGQYAGPEFFEIFSYHLLKGDAATVLDDPNSIVVSESLARKYFGDDWRESGDIPGRVMLFDNRYDATVTGVFQDVPANSSYLFDYVVPAEEYARRNDWVNDWENGAFTVFVRLTPGADPAEVTDKIEHVVRENDETSNVDLFLQPYRDIYLRSDFEGGQLVGGRIEYVRVFSLVALFILLIAAINFMNLATARSGMRATEIGVRKAIGATRANLAGQFMAESILMAVVAYLLATGLVLVLLPSFNTLTGKSVSIDLLSPDLWLKFGGLAVLTGLVAGSYPSLNMSAHSAIAMLRNSLSRTPRRSKFRAGLVTFQFSISVVLIIATITISRQMGFIRSKNLGLDRENLLYVDLEGGIKDQYDSFKTELLREPGILSVASSSQNPLRSEMMTRSVNWEGKDPDDLKRFYVINVDYDFIEMVGMELNAGRYFSPEYGSDSTFYLINKTAVQATGMEDPIGERIRVWGRWGEIAGVIEDFHLRDMFTPIEPVVFRLAPEGVNKVFVRCEVGRTATALASLEKTYAGYNSAYPLEYHFLDDTFEEMYKSEFVIGKLADYFALLAVLIACLGLYGLAMFSAELRTKEIGIRKVLGSSVRAIVLLLTREFAVIILISCILAAPLAYAGMNTWLQGFAYHIDQSARTYVLAGVLAFVIALATVSYRAIRAAMVNPVESLQSE